MKAFKVVLSLTLVFGLASVSLAGNTHDPVVKKRMHHQQMRIRQGIHSGSLTPREVLMLERQQARIRCEERLFKADGVLTKRERAKLHHDLNRASRNIYRQKHDPQRRNR